MKPFVLLDAVGTTGAGTAVDFGSTAVRAKFGSQKMTFHAVQVGNGAQTATVLIQGSNDGTNYLLLGTITLSATTTAQDGFAMEAPWRYVRANCTAQSGTSAALTVTMGVAEDGGK